MPQDEDAKFIFLKKILSYRKNYSCKDYLLFAIIPFQWVFFVTNFFLEYFLLEFPYFFHSCWWKFLLYVIRTLNSLLNSIYFFSWLIHQWFVEQILFTLKKIFVSFFKITHVYVFNNLIIKWYLTSSR